MSTNIQRNTAQYQKYMLIRDEETDYHEAIQRYNAMKVNYKWDMTVLPVLFTQTEKKSMLSHTKQLLEDGLLMIDKRFDKFLTRLHICVDNDVNYSRNLNKCSHNLNHNCDKDSLCIMLTRL